MVGFFFLFAGLFLATCGSHLDRETIYNVRVTDKERINERDSNGYYLVYTDDEVFQNADTWLEGKFSSSDLQGSLHVDRCYALWVYGWRIPFLSAYRNIVSAEEVSCLIPDDAPLSNPRY